MYKIIELLNIVLRSELFFAMLWFSFGVFLVHDFVCVCCCFFCIHHSPSFGCFVTKND